MRKLLMATLALGLLGDATLAQTSMIDGEVTRIDEAAGKITIRHGPLKQFGMDEPMTMVYRADDAALFKTVKPGDKIRFTATRVNGQFTVTDIEKVR
jgi:Cu(I)/Ag(I) efflux system periplasmic protein CusF